MENKFTFTDPRAPPRGDKRNLNKHTTITLLKNSSKGKNIEGSRGYTLSHKAILTNISSKVPAKIMADTVAHTVSPVLKRQRYEDHEFLRNARWAPQ